MTSTELNVGFSGKTRPSSRVLKPPGGGHSDIFGESEVKPNPPRPKYDQQNSSNINCVMNTVDPNEAVVKTRVEIDKAKAIFEAEKKAAAEEAEKAAKEQENDSPKEEAKTPGGRVRIPPGGFSSGLW